MAMGRFCFLILKNNFKELFCEELILDQRYQLMVFEVPFDQFFSPKNGSFLADVCIST